jgi:hypothetical protein
MIKWVDWIRVDPQSVVRGEDRVVRSPSSVGQKAESCDQRCTLASMGETDRIRDVMGLKLDVRDFARLSGEVRYLSTSAVLRYYWIVGVCVLIRKVRVHRRKGFKELPLCSVRRFHQSSQLPAGSLAQAL